jgi:hypothetical protein
MCFEFARKRNVTSAAKVDDQLRGVQQSPRTRLRSSGLVLRATKRSIARARASRRPPRKPVSHGMYSTSLGQCWRPITSQSWSFKLTTWLKPVSHRMSGRLGSSLSSHHISTQVLETADLAQNPFHTECPVVCTLAQ